MSATSGPLCRVVISYARADKQHRKTFRNHVADLERSGVEVFDDQDIPVGVRWETALFGSIERADIVVLLLTSNYVSSGFCMDEELPRAMRRWQAGECLLFPVNVAPFDLTQKSPLRQLQWIPSGKSVTEYGTAAAREWKKVTQELRKLVEDMSGATGGGASAASYEVGGGGVETPGGRATTACNGNGNGNSISNSTLHGPSLQIGEFTGDMTISFPQHPPVEGPDSPTQSR